MLLCVYLRGLGTNHFVLLLHCHDYVIFARLVGKQKSLVPRYLVSMRYVYRVGSPSGGKGPRGLTPDSERIFSSMRGILCRSTVPRQRIFAG